MDQWGRRRVQHPCRSQRTPACAAGRTRRPPAPSCLNGASGNVLSRCAYRSARHHAESHPCDRHRLTLAHSRALHKRAAPTAPPRGRRAKRRWNRKDHSFKLAEGGGIEPLSSQGHPGFRDQLHTIARHPPNGRKERGSNARSLTAGYRLATGHIASLSSFRMLWLLELDDMAASNYCCGPAATRLAHPYRVEGFVGALSRPIRFTS